ncbi:MAG TPA: hydrogenase iron-sulfur subunit [bacterium]|nr:hydrogenase iron-sulfur subunit [bacterium]
MPELERPAPAPARGPKIVGFLCDFAVDVSAIAAPDGTMRDVPNVTLIKVPCSGFIRPAWLEFALRNGAEGTFVCGCPLGDCFNRFGNNLIGDRVTQLRRRFERQKIHPDRIAAIYFGLHDQEAFVGAVRAFSAHVAGLPGPVVPAPRAAGGASLARAAGSAAAGGPAPDGAAARPAGGPGTAGAGQAAPPADTPSAPGSTGQTAREEP